MKSNILSKLAIIPALILSMSMMNGQTTENNANPEKTIRIKMVKNINGVETIFDTTIVGGDWNDMGDMPNMDVDIIMDSIPGGNGEQVIVKTINIESMGDNDSNVIVRVMDENDPEFQKMVKEHGVTIEENTPNGQHKVIIINEENGNGNGNGDKTKNGKDHKMEMKVIIQTCNVKDLDKEDKKLLRNETKSFNENLQIDQVDFYPNPNNGKFNLSFKLRNEGPTEISIFNTEGKRVYSEILDNFTGSYKNEIDISKNATGIYYISVTQGKDSWFKKMILE